MKLLSLIFSTSLFLSSCSKDSSTDTCIDPSKIGKSSRFCCIPDPVCGCDGIEYFNECAAENAGVISWTKGPCSTSGN